MKNMPTVVLMFIAALTVHAQPVYVSDKAEIRFFSSAPLEDIQASSYSGRATIDMRTGSVYVRVPIRSFRFRKKLMQEHFNDKYLESDKYPYATFKGNIQENTAAQKEGEHTVTVQGEMDIHNVTKPYTMKATLKTSGEQVQVHSVFNVKLADHKIGIPRIVVKNIAEVVEVTVSARLLPGAETGINKPNR